jgi:hypothetical protein
MAGDPEWNGAQECRARSQDSPGKIGMRGLVLTGFVAMWLGTSAASVAEVCRFAGTTQPAGQVAVTADVTSSNGTTRVDVAVSFETTTLFWFRVRYLMEEVSVWRAGEFERIGVNTRYLVGDHIVRQLWDLFQRENDAIRAYRVQAKSLADFRGRHPGFVRHWDPSTFGQPWLDDYLSASPERRADLDLKVTPLPPKLRSPLALAFYWSRWLPPGGQNAPVFLPGFKADMMVDVPIIAGTSVGGRFWQTALRHPALSKTPPSTARAWMSHDGHLRQLALDLHEPRGSARGLITQEGCHGLPLLEPPAGQ